jgi:uncharacterized protein YlaN (UPF0358 family)
MHITRSKKVREILSSLDGEVIAFMRKNATKIVSQAKADMDSEVPTVPLFEEYLASLERRIEREVRRAGFFNGKTKEIMNYYRDVFYYSALPDLIDKYG